MNNPYREIRAAEQVAHKIEDTSLCAQVTDGVGLLSKLFNLSDYDAMSQSPFFAAVNIISNSIAQMTWEVKKYDDGIEVPDNFYANHLFDQSLLTQFTTVKQMIRDTLVAGNGFAYIHRDRKGIPKYLEYLAPGRCTIVYDELKNTLLYKIPSITNKFVEPINVLHFVMHSYNGVTGIPILTFAKNTIKLSGAADKSATDFFKSGCTVHGVLHTDTPRLTQVQRDSIRKAWAESQLGTGTGLPVLEGGMDYTPISSNSRDAQMLETRQFNVQEWARWFNISPILLGDLSKSSYNSIEQAQLALVLQCLQPYVSMIEHELNRKIITFADRDKFYLDICEEDIIKGDKASQINYLTSLVNNGILTVNEVRETLGYTPMDGCDDLIIPFTKIEDNKINSTGDKNVDDRSNNEENKDKEENEDEEK